MKAKFFGLLFFAVYLIANLLILKDYGLSWDYHYHHFAGLYHLGLKVPQINEKSEIPFSPPDPRLTIEDPFGPFTQIIPTLSQYLLTEKAGILPFDIAYNLPLVIFGALGVLVFYYFLLELFNFEVACLGSLFLALHPYYFGYLHNNMKDTPNAFAFTLSLWLFWRLTKLKNLKSLFLSALSFAFAFNIKINSIFIPVVCGIYLLLISYRSSILSKKNIFVWSYFLLAPVFALILWWPFWKDPLGKILELPHFYSLNTFNMPVLFFGNIVRSGINIPPVYPYVYLAITSPISVMISVMFGLFICLYFSAKGKNNYLFLLIWLLVPLARYLIPKTSAIDGVRHFLEVLYPFSAIAAVGVWFFIRKSAYKIKAIVYFSFLTILLVNIINTHPYQTSFFSSIIGGIKGAEGKFDLDFWGTPQKEAVSWLNKNAPPNSTIHIVMAQSTAATYLRPDLRLKLNSRPVNESDYIVLLNRRSFFAIYGVEDLPREKKSQNKIVYQKDLDGVSLVWIFRK